MERPARMTHQPLTDLGMLLGGVIVRDGMDELTGRHRRLDCVEEADELLMPMLLHTSTDDRAIQHVEGCEQRGGAVSDVVVRHSATAALLHWQAWLGAIERLYLAFLVDPENDSMRWRIHVEPDDVSELGSELWIVGQRLPATYAPQLQLSLREPDRPSWLLDSGIDLGEPCIRVRRQGKIV